jgi:hypothetical protein
MAQNHSDTISQSPCGTRNEGHTSQSHNAPDVHLQSHFPLHIVYPFSRLTITVVFESYHSFSKHYTKHINTVRGKMQFP